MFFEITLTSYWSISHVLITYLHERTWTLALSELANRVNQEGWQSKEWTWSSPGQVLRGIDMTSDPKRMCFPGIQVKNAGQVQGKEWSAMSNIADKSP